MPKPISTARIMRPLLLILRYRLLVFRRWTGDHAFEIFFLGPVIVGGALWVLDRQLGVLRAPVGRALAAGAGEGPGTVSLILALLLLAVGLPATFRELYDPRRPGVLLDALPVAASARLHASLAAELARCLPAFGVLLLAASALAGELLPPLATFAERSARLAAALATLALARFAILVTSVRLRRAGPITGAGAAVVVSGMLALALAVPGPVAKLPLLPFQAPAAQLENVFADALATAHPVSGEGARIGPLAATAAWLYLLTLGLYLAWHRRDLELGGRLGAPRRSARPSPSPGRLAGRLPRPLAAQIRRDLLLVARRFSPAVPLAGGVALLLDAAVLTVLFDAGLPALWRLRLAVAGLTLSVLAVAALMPFLLKHQLPHFWIEKSTGVDLERIWEAKLWTAALVAGIPTAAGVAILTAAPGLAADARGWAILQLAAGAWIVTSILGLAVFEIADQPLLGLVFGALLGLALAALFVFYPQAWWLWAVLYLWVASQIAGRATRRVRLLEAAA